MFEILGIATVTVLALLLVTHSLSWTPSPIEFTVILFATTAAIKTLFWITDRNAAHQTRQERKNSPTTLGSYKPTSARSNGTRKSDTTDGPDDDILIVNPNFGDTASSAPPPHRNANLSGGNHHTSHNSGATHHHSSHSHTSHHQSTDFGHHGGTSDSGHSGGDAGGGGH